MARLAAAEETRHPSLLHQDLAALGIDPLELYFWDVRGYLVIRNAMDSQWVADCNAALDDEMPSGVASG